MSALLRAELLKLRTTRTFAALTAVAVATSALLAGLTALLSDVTEESVLVDVFASDTSSLFILLLAIVGITGEWRHRTIAGSLLAAPDRVRFLLAKTLAFAAAGLVLSLLISIGVAVLGYSVLESRGQPVPELGEVLELIGKNAIVAMLLGAFGVAFGSVVRNQVVGVVGVLVLGFAVEPALMAFAPGCRPVRRLLRAPGRRGRVSRGRARDRHHASGARSRRARHARLGGGVLFARRLPPATPRSRIAARRRSPSFHGRGVETALPSKPGRTRDDEANEDPAEWRRGSRTRCRRCGHSGRRRRRRRRDGEADHRAAHSTRRAPRPSPTPAAARCPVPRSATRRATTRSRSLSTTAARPTSSSTARFNVVGDEADDSDED